MTNAAKPEDKALSTRKFCGAKKKQGPGRCRRPAGWGTDHPGHGKCKLHGGASLVRHGRYSKIKRATLADVAAGVGIDDPNPLDLQAELRILRALLEGVLSKGDPEEDVGSEESKIAAGMIKDVAGVVERIHRMRESNAVSRQQLNRLCAEMAKVVEHVVAERVQGPDAGLMLDEIKEGWMTIQIV